MMDGFFPTASWLIFWDRDLGEIAGCEPLSRFYKSGGGRRHFSVCCSNSLGNAGSEFHPLKLTMH